MYKTSPPTRRWLEALRLVFTGIVMTFVGADHAPGYRPVCATWVFVLRHPVLGGVDDLTCLQQACSDGDSSAFLHVSCPSTTPAQLTHASMIFTRCVEAHVEADSAVRWFRSCAPDCQPRPTRNVGRLELEQNQGFCPKRIWWLGLIINLAVDRSATRSTGCFWHGQDQRV